MADAIFGQENFQGRLGESGEISETGETWNGSYNTSEAAMSKETSWAALAKEAFGEIGETSKTGETGDILSGWCWCIT